MVKNGLGLNVQVTVLQSITTAPPWLFSQFWKASSFVAKLQSNTTSIASIVNWGAYVSTTVTTCDTVDELPQLSVTVTV